MKTLSMPDAEAMSMQQPVVCFSKAIKISSWYQQKLGQRLKQYQGSGNEWMSWSAVKQRVVDERRSTYDD